MSVPTFVDLQGFIVGEIFVVKEFAVLREGHVLSHYIFGCSYPWDLLSKLERSCASWLIAKHHGLRWEDGMISYYMAEEFITKAVIGTEDNDDDDNNLVYVKGITRMTTKFAPGRCERRCLHQKYRRILRKYGISKLVGYYTYFAPETCNKLCSTKCIQSI